VLMLSWLRVGVLLVAVLTRSVSVFKLHFVAKFMFHPKWRLVCGRGIQDGY